MEDKKNNTAALRPAQLPGNAYGEGRGVAHGLGLDTSQIMNLNTQNAQRRHMVGMSPGMPPQKKYRGSTQNLNTSTGPTPLTYNKYRPATANGPKKGVRMNASKNRYQHQMALNLRTASQGRVPQ